MSNAILHSSQYQEYRRIDLIVIHCSATRASRSYTVDDCRRDHRVRGFANIGYHYYITRDGVVHAGRPLYQEGAHARGYNNNASKRKVYGINANGSVVKLSSNSKNDIQPGMEIVVPQKNAKKKLSTTEIIGIGSGIAALASVIVALLNAIK